MWYRNGVYGKENDMLFYFYPSHRVSIDKARNTAVQWALTNDCSHIFFYDDDMILDPYTFIKLYERDVDAVMANCIIRGTPFRNMFFKIATRTENNEPVLDFYTDYEQDVPDNGLLEVAAFGNACTLYKTDIFKRTTEPWFRTMPGVTEDIFFCCKAGKEANAKFYVDTFLDIGHICRPLIVRPSNVEQMRKLNKNYDEMTS